MFPFATPMLGGGGKPPVVLNFPGNNQLVNAGAPPAGAKRLKVEMLAGGGGGIMDETYASGGPSGDYYDMVTDHTWVLTAASVFVRAPTGTFSSTTSPCGIYFDAETTNNRILYAGAYKGDPGNSSLAGVTIRRVPGVTAGYADGDGVAVSGGSATWAGSAPNMAGAGGYADAQGSNYGGGGGAQNWPTQSAGPGGAGFVRLIWEF